MDGKVVIGVDLETKSFEEEIAQTEQKLNKLVSAYEKASKMSGKFKPNEKAMSDLRVEIEKTTNQLVNLKDKQAKIDSSGVSNFKENIDNAGNSLKDVIKKVTKWGLALFGIRSIYSMIRGAMSTISSENSQIATDIEYMKWVIAQTLKPVVEWVVHALYTALALVNSISMTLFHVNLLAGKSAEAFKKSKKSVDGVASGLKEAKKQLAGFDEMNVLQDNSSSSGGGGATGGGIEDWEMPDMSKYENQVEKIKKAWTDLGDQMKDLVRNTTLDEWINAFGEWGIAVMGVTETLYGLWEMITGLVQFVIGIVQVVVAAVTGDTKLMEEGIENIIDGLTNFIMGFIDIVVGLVHTLVGLVIGLVVSLVKMIWAALQGLAEWVYNVVIKPIGKLFADLGTGVTEGVRFTVDLMKILFSGVVDFFKGIVNSIVTLFKNIGTKAGNVVGSAFKAVVNGVLGAMETILNTPIKAINALIKTINKVPGINLGKLNTFNLPRLAKGGIVNMPGSGVMVGSAIAGERGAEGVIPLTDSQQMALLGEAIGKYITINANITNTMNGRVISKELQKIQNENDFAFNR